MNVKPIDRETLNRSRAAHNATNPRVPMRPLQSSVSPEESNFTCKLQALIAAVDGLPTELRCKAALDSIRRLAESVDG